MTAVPTVRGHDLETSAGRGRWFGLAVIVLAQLLVVLDSTVLAVALPSAQQDLGFSDASRQWVLTAYTLAFGGLLLLGGRIADRIGLKRCLALGVTGFGVVSAIGGAANSGGMLIACRAAQGVFAALLAPCTLALINVIFPDKRERGKAFGIYSGVLVAGGALGLLIGGSLTEYLSWRWCMYVNVPVTAVALLGALTVLPLLPGHHIKLDLFGGLVGCSGLVAMVYGFGHVAEQGWDSALVIGLLIASVLLLGLFTVIQSKRSSPLLPLRIVTDRNRAGAFATMVFSSIGLFGMLLFLTYQLQEVMGYSPLRTGFAFLPLLAANVSVSAMSATLLLPRVRPRYLLATGLTIAALGLFLLTRMTPESSYWDGILPGEVVLGLGLGTVMAPCAATATNEVAKSDTGVASAFFNTSTQIGASIGTALLNTIAANATKVYQGAHPGIRAVRATVHGYVVAGRWAAGLLLMAALMAVVLITAAPFRPSEDDEWSDTGAAGVPG
ncbi:MFS transporter [Streptomyces solisilvae]|uniref:MFS transporter n=1 Tax=Streptomyces TaxID=1883 RepID=UPI0009A1D368|nr:MULTISPECIES: MFS transporter [Streptomyces]MCD9588707.1 MFS transporter [Streptomyces sp. 8ZJF_21]